MDTPAYRLRGLITSALLATLAGCCTSFGRIAAAHVDAPEHLPDGAALMEVVDAAARHSGLAGHLDKSYEPRYALYRVHGGDGGVLALIDNQALTIRLSWGRIGESEFASRVQGAIEQEFRARYHGSLEFKDLPCGWLGP